MSRRREWAENMTARFAAGTFERIATVLKDDEDRTDFVREAVERELKRRERK
jgi:transcriptional regulator NrdR family protein